MKLAEYICDFCGNALSNSGTRKTHINIGGFIRVPVWEDKVWVRYGKGHELRSEWHFCDVACFGDGLNREYRCGMMVSRIRT